jgi:hypothetical protein
MLVGKACGLKFDAWSITGAGSSHFALKKLVSRNAYGQEIEGHLQVDLALVWGEQSPVGVADRSLLDALAVVAMGYGQQLMLRCSPELKTYMLTEKRTMARRSVS